MTTMTEPPRIGRGSSREAWAEYAVSLGIDVPDELGRNGIIDLIEADPFEEEENAVLGVTDAEIDQMRAEYDAQLAEKDAEIEALRPTKPVASFFYETPEDVEAFFGKAKLDEMVDASIAAENRDRSKKGYDRIVYSVEDRAAKRVSVIESLLADKTASTNLPPEEGPLYMSLKMIHPDGSLRQIPYEVQVNNIAGSLADGWVRYEQKGFKRTEPMLCPTRNCYEQAATARGKWTFKGFCSEDHLARTAPSASAPTE